MDGLIIRDFMLSDLADFKEMCGSLFNSEAVVYEVGEKQMEDTFQEIMAGNAFLRGLIIEKDGRTAGYAQLSFTYSNEAGGLVVWLEELYIKPEWQNRGLGRSFMQWLLQEYQGKAKRYRLEVSPENERVKDFYRAWGFGELAYQQMILKA